MKKTAKIHRQFDVVDDVVEFVTYHFSSPSAHTNLFTTKFLHA